MQQAISDVPKLMDCLRKRNVNQKTSIIGNVILIIFDPETEEILAWKN